MKKLLRLTILVTLISTSALADTSKPMKSSASITAFCTISAENINFDSYLPGNGHIYSTGNLSFICTKNITAQVGINLDYVGGNTTNKNFGFAENGAYFSRFMKNSGSVLRYNLFQDAENTKIFGGSNWFVNTGGARPNIVGTGLKQNIPIYATLYANQYVKPGNYSDTAFAYISY